MTFVSVEYYLFLTGGGVAYYLLPLKFRWLALLAESLTFYYIAASGGRKIFLALMLISYLGGLLLEKLSEKKTAKKFCLFFALLLIGAPLLAVKEGNFLIQSFLRKDGWSFFAPMGLSFFTIQMISYLVDIYYGKIKAQKNPLKYALFVSFFPQIIQGPIPRYQQLMPQLETGHRFDSENITAGFQMILWGFFLKFMIADKAGVIVDSVFCDNKCYKGTYVIVAGVLYSLQLYTDFQACTKLAQGAARMFGIEVVNNFNHPYFSRSIKEFWGRWHMSFSGWLKDYVYIPLGGNRKGKLRKYLNIILTFLVSGMWHGSGFRFLFWGGMHAVYQIVGEWTNPIREKIYALFGIRKNSAAQNAIKRFGTFCLAALAWIIFRADSLRCGLSMLASIFTVYNPWILFDDSLFSLGLGWKEMMVLLFSLAVLFWVSRKQEKGVSIRKMVVEQPLVIRWMIYIAVIVIVMVFGTYGYGFNAQDFIYGGF